MIFFGEQTREVFKALGKLMITLSACAVLFAHAEIESHDMAYQQALDKVELGYKQLHEELDRIHYGEVAHFDFLQYAHIEVLRHARALRHPPSDRGMESREPIIEHATQLVTAAESLELALSDFLRSHALLDSAISNTVDIVQQAGMTSEGLAQSALYDLGRAATQFKENMQPDRLNSLQVAFENVSKTDSINQDWLDALVLQQGLIETHSGAYERVVAELEASELVQALGSLKAIYSEAGTRIVTR